MNRRFGVRVLGRCAFVLAVAGSFTFGFVQALSARANGCEWNPPTFLGECLGEVNCQRTCEFYLGWLGECYEDEPGVFCCICAT